MAVAPESQRRRLNGLEVLQPAPAAPVEPLRDCLDELRQQWRLNGGLASLWQDWPSIAGDQLAPHCRPLQMQRQVLTIGASHPQWRQALQYNKPQLLASLRAAGHTVRDLRIQQHHAAGVTSLESEHSIWARHPSRIDVHGVGECPACGRPAPKGELALWSVCGFCHRQTLTSSA